ncbi:chromate transporter [Myroides sp. LJL119]
MIFNLFIKFSKIGIFTIGGGHAVIPLIEKEFINDYGLDKDDFYQLITISESLPGVFATNIAALTGYKIAGSKGAISAALGTIIAPLIIITCIASFFEQFQENIYVDKAFTALRPAAVALIVSPMFSIAKSNNLTFKKAIFPILALVAMIFLSVSPLWIICIGILMAFIYSINLKK